MHMVKVVAKVLDDGRVHTHFGSEPECEEWLRTLFPRETATAHGLSAMMDEVNREGFGEVTVEPYNPPMERNMLPEDYDAQVHREDPWKREADEG